MGRTHEGLQPPTRNSASDFVVIVVLALALMAVKIKGLEKIKRPEELKAPIPPSQEDVLSTADALQWRQEFLWHRTIAKVCPNPWIDDQPCRRMAELL